MKTSEGKGCSDCTNCSCEDEVSARNCLIVCPRPLERAPGELAEVIGEAFVIAVDGGLTNVLGLGLVPSLWVGDGDSVKAGALGKARCPKLKLPRSKDYTDLEYALHVAGSAFLDGLWEGNVVLLGAQGGRFDHDIGTMLSVQSWLQELAVAVGPDRCPGLVSYGAHGMWIATVSQAAFERKKGAIFSVVTFGGEPRLSITGAKYNVRKKSLDHASMGLSNEGTGKMVVVHVHPPVRQSPGSGRRRATAAGVAEKPAPVFVMVPENP